MAKEPGLAELTPFEQSAIDRAEKQEDTRSRIALIFIWAYLGIIVILIVLSTFSSLTGDSVKDYLLAIGSPLGFIVGYYFKSANSD